MSFTESSETKLPVTIIISQRRQSVILSPTIPMTPRHRKQESIVYKSELEYDSRQSDTSSDEEDFPSSTYCPMNTNRNRRNSLANVVKHNSLAKDPMSPTWRLKNPRRTATIVIVHHAADSK